MRAYDWLVRLAPSSAADLKDPAARETFRAVCAAARRDGRLRFAIETTRELVNVAVVIAAARFANGRFPRFRLSSARRDARMAVRSLRAGGGATAIAVTTLALGIGINAAIFSVLDAVMFREVPFRDHERLVEIHNFDARQKMSYPGTSRKVVSGWRAQTDLFDRVEAYEAASLVYETARGAEMISGATVTPGLFDLLGVRPAVGRPFTTADGGAGRPLTAIVNDAFWRKELGGVADLTHAVVQLDGRRYAVVGVMPRSFRFPTGGEQIWLPFDLADPPTESPAGRMMRPLARLAPGVAMTTADREAKARGSRVNEAAGWAAELTATVWQPGRGVDQKTARSLWVLAGAVAFLFLIVCANVANLALTRALSRTRELATCAALGASPGDLIRAALLEHALLAAIATAVGAVIAAGAVRVAVAALPDSMIAGTMNAIDLDGRALAFMAAAGAIAAVLFGLPPALLASRSSITAVLGRDGRTTSGSRAARRLRSGLVIGEVAISAVLLLGAAMMARSFLRLASVDQGYDPMGLVSVRLGLPAAGYSGDVKLRDQTARELARRIAALPEAAAVTVGNLPAADEKINVGTLEMDRDPGKKSGNIIVPINQVPANYFSAIGMRLIEGRTFSPSDLPGAIIVSARFAQKYFNGDAVGQRFRFTGHPWRYVVGVAADAAAREDSREAQLALYYPAGEDAGAFTMSRATSKIVDFRNLLIRTSKPDVVFKALPDIVRSVDPSIVIWKTALVEHMLADEIARPRIVFVLLMVFAAFGVLLAMAGLYGVLATLVAQRRQELGVRLALGAPTARIRGLILGNGLALCGIGLAIGLGAAVPLVRMMRSLLYEVGPSDPLAIGGAVLLLSGTAALACWWPARDAARTDPTVLLRCD